MSAGRITGAQARALREGAEREGSVVQLTMPHGKALLLARAADLAREVEALEAERDAARASLEAEREKAAQHCGAVADIVWQGGKAEADEALDAMRERTERNEAALRVVALWLGGPHQSSQAADVEALARAKGAELDALRAIIEGRTTPPTREEAEAHEAAGGLWRWIVTVDGSVSWGLSSDIGPTCDTRPLSGVPRRIGSVYAVRWWPLDSTGRPCGWPPTGDSK